MAYQVLARKYRPQTFSDVIGQDHVTRTLLNALTQGRIAHGYIFSGHRGIGKTTIARILASALNCRNAIGSAARPTAEPCNQCESCIEVRQGNAVDVIEIDAATNRGIDEIRELRDGARYRPSRDKYKIYILDEAHQITDAAFNALLKTLEEPPEHIVFMMATTQPEDIPQTIRSRCQHFSFHAVKIEDILGQLRAIAAAEQVGADEATLSLLAEAGDGSMRDALSIMDQAIASAPTAAGHATLDAAQVRELMGSVSNAVYEEVLAAVHANNSADVLAITGRLLDAGNGAAQLARQFVRYLRNAVVAKVTGLLPDADATGAAADLLQISPEERRRVARSAALFTEEELARFLSILLRTFDDLGFRQEQRLHLELGLLKLVHVQRLVPVEEILSQLGEKPRANPSTVPTAPRTPAASAPAATPLKMSAAADSARRESASATATAGALALAPEAIADAASQPVQQAPQLGPQLVPAIVPGPAPGPLPDADALRDAFVAALTAAGQQSAAEQVEEAGFTLEGGALTLQTTLTPVMLDAMFRAETLGLLKTALRSAYPEPLKLVLLPGVPTAAASTPKKPRPAAVGSAAELAERHPLVQEARRLFSAEISNVIDLREK